MALELIDDETAEELLEREELLGAELLETLTAEALLLLAEAELLNTEELVTTGVLEDDELGLALDEVEVFRLLATSEEVAAALEETELLDRLLTLVEEFMELTPRLSLAEDLLDEAAKLVEVSF